MTASISTSTQNVVDYVASFEMFKAPAVAKVEHVATVVRAPAGSRQPWIAQCSCGWASASYVRDHAAQVMADAHMAGEL